MTLGKHKTKNLIGINAYFQMDQVPDHDIQYKQCKHHGFGNQQGTNVE